jgi:hypothetical protein
VGKSLHELRTAGFKPLREGRIHLRCPSCGRKMSNMPRDVYDPPLAMLMEVCCDRCSAGCKIDGGDYYDASGLSVPNNYDCERCGDMVFYGVRHDCECEEPANG